jgi:hypothetical protein
MTGLVKLQALFQDHVFTRSTDAVVAFVGNETASTEARLGVYYDAYRLRLVECLRNDFPGLCALMTEESFDSVCRRYIAEHPSTDPNVRWIGRRLADFLATDHATAGQPCLAEMARFEWARGLAFDGPDAAVMKPDQLTRLAAEEWPTLRLRLHPTLHRSQFDWNIGPIWRAVCAEEATPTPAKLENPEQLALWRRGTTVYWRSLDEPEARALDAFGDGENFADVCSGLCEWIAEESVPEQMAGLLRQWVAEGLVIKRGSN